MNGRIAMQLQQEEQEKQKQRIRRLRKMRRIRRNCLYTITILSILTGILWILPTVMKELQREEKRFPVYDKVVAKELEATEITEAAKPAEAEALVEEEPGWQLQLVNQWNPITEYDDSRIIDIGEKQSVDERCYKDLMEMLEDCRAEGISPKICSSYRSWETQERLYLNKVERLMAKGYQEEAAYLEAAKAVAVPGTSEHQIGLAVDIVDELNQHLNSSQERTATQQWLMENSWKYGFILRYPKGKSELTGVIYEPWHYRYVGREAAEEIYEQEICLEEYVENLAK